MKSGIYKIQHKDSGRLYIGSSKNYKQRMNNHRGHLNRNVHANQSLQNAWNKYGQDKFYFELMFTCKVKDLIKYEQMMMDKYQSYKKKNGYNIRTEANSNIGVPTSKHQKEVASKLWKNKDFRDKIYKGITKFWENPEHLKYKAGIKVGRITILSAAPSIKSKARNFLCKCFCGREWITTTSSLLNGTKSCGCIIAKFVVVNGKSVNVSEAERILGLPVGAIPQRRRNYKETHQQAVDFLSKKIYRSRHEKKSA